MYIKDQIEANKSNISYRNHLLEKYNSTYISTLYTFATHAVLHILLHMPFIQPGQIFHFKR